MKLNFFYPIRENVSSNPKKCVVQKAGILIVFFFVQMTIVAQPIAEKWKQLPKSNFTLQLSSAKKSKVEIINQRIFKIVASENDFFNNTFLLDTCVVEKNINSNGMRFLKSFYILNSKINGEVDLRESSFASFILDRCSVQGDFNVSNDSSYSYFILSDSRVGGDANFNTLKVEENSFFHKTSFDSTVSFEYADLDTAVFQFSEFHQYATFYKADFIKHVSFDDAIFYNNVSFKSVSFYETAFFRNTVFMDSIDFSNVSDIRKRVDLTFVQTDTIPNSGRRCLINLMDSDISQIKIDYQKFRLYFPKNASSEKISNVYQALLFNFKKDGFMDSYAALDKEYQQYLYIGGNKTHWYHYILNGIDLLWWDYSYERSRPVGWAIVFVLFFTLINYFNYERLITQVYEIDNLPIRLEKERSVLAKFYYSFIYSSVVFFSINVKTERLKFDKIGLVCYFFLMYISGIVCLAYIANYILRL